MKIIINADDLGHSQRVNDAIFELLVCRWITSTTILANGPYFQHATAKTKDFASISFGVHLNLTEFRPLTIQRAFNSSGLLAPSGEFNGSIHKILPTPALLQAVEEEWTAQVQKVLDAGMPISHLDSHHHVHTIPWLFFSLKKIQKLFSIQKVRTTLNLYDLRSFQPSRVLFLKKKLWNWSLRNFYRTKTTDIFTTFQWFVSEMEKKNDINKASSAELMCHPGYDWSTVETTLLSSDWNRAFRHQLISYRDL